MVRNSKSAKRRDCASCDREHSKCLLSGKPFDVALPGRPGLGRFTVRDRADIPAMITWARRNDAHADLPEFAIIRELGICPLPLFTTLSAECMRLYQHCQATNDFSIVEGKYYDQPAFYMESMHLIAAEEAVIRSEKQEGDNG
jgi:hypothetical protein